MIEMIVCLVVGVVLFSYAVWAVWCHPMLPRWDRIGFGMLASGLLWGGWDRWMHRVIGIGDAIFLVGMLLLVVRLGAIHGGIRTLYDPVPPPVAKNSGA